MRNQVALVRWFEQLVALSFKLDTVYIDEIFMRTVVFDFFFLRVTFRIFELEIVETWGVTLLINLFLSFTMPNELTAREERALSLRDIAFLIHQVYFIDATRAAAAYFCRRKCTFLGCGKVPIDVLVVFLAIWNLVLEFSDLWFNWLATVHRVLAVISIVTPEFSGAAAICIL